MNSNAPQRSRQNQLSDNVERRLPSPNSARDERGFQGQPLSLATGNLPQQQSTPAQVNPRFSYMATPVEAQAPTFPSTQRPPTIPQSPTSPDEEITHQELPQVSHYPPEKAELEVPADQHPAYSAPFAEVNRYQHAQAESVNIAPTTPAPQSSDPIPAKTAPYSPSPLHTSNAAELSSGPYAPHATHPTTTFSAPPFSPNAPTGPNGLSLSLHQPGQIAHPNMSSSSPAHWNTSLLDCSHPSTCLLGLWCPCILYGRTAHRLARKAAHQDPTDLLSLETCNGSCALWAFACGLQGVLAAVQRVRVRHAYKIAGSVGRDALVSCCCVCCVLVQSELEVKEREERARRLAGPAGGAYVANERMTYQPQGR
ncbi:MAG: hypothetical protein M1821_000146 [Bathelium mastoideum]|nr:MAG: hypothetical protein M1821_000146 [Bathelium mastoideum]KAI9687822.1 MAG: hypothetical protein M1822_001902 [Bathelium mastoideum]